jgi:hypothetical protein
VVAGEGSCRDVGQADLTWPARKCTGRRQASGLKACNLCKASAFNMSCRTPCMKHIPELRCCMLINLPAAACFKLTATDCAAPPVRAPLSCCDC